MEDPTAVLERVDAMLDELHALPVSCWSTAEQADWLTGLQSARARLEALCVDAAATASSSGVVNLVRDPKVRTLRQFVALQPGIDPGDVGSDLHLAGRLEPYPALADAFRQGRVTRSHVLAILNLENPATRWALRRDVEHLVLAAEHATWVGFAEFCGQFMVYADADGYLADERIRNRTASVKTNGDGVVTGTFRLDPLAGRLTREAIAREVQRLTDIDADPTHPDAKHRTPGQRTADAIANLIAKGSANTDAKPAPPLVHIVMGEDALTEMHARRHARAHGQPLDDLHIDNADPLRRCELIDQTPIHPDHVADLLPTADIRRIILSADGEVLDHSRPVRLDQVADILTVADIRRIVLDTPSETLDYGRTRRLYPHHSKLAILVKHRGRCAEAGCHAPLAWLQTDHIHPWSKGGTTDIANGATRCAACNKAKRDTIASSNTAPRGDGGAGPPGAGPPDDGGPPDEPIPWTDEPLPFDDPPRAA